MASNSTDELNALAQVMRADEEEARRVFWWSTLPRIDRARALDLARLDRSRAGACLSTFTVPERAILHASLSGHIARMQILMQCTGISVEHRPSVDQVGAVTRLAELEQQQEATRRRRQAFSRLQEQEQEQEQVAGRLH